MGMVRDRYGCGRRIRLKFMKKHRHFKDLFDLSGRVALVTGATRGLGKTMALTLAQAGARVAMCSRDEKEARTAASDIARSTGQGTLGMAADVSRKADVDQMVALVEKDLGSIDILVASLQLYDRFQYCHRWRLDCTVE